MPERADVLYIRPGFLVEGGGHCTGHVGRLMDPAALLARTKVDVSQNHPESGCAIADGQFRRCCQPALFQAVEQVTPAVRILPEPVHDRQHIFPAVLVSTDNHQHTLTITVQVRCETNTVCPDAGVAFALWIALAPYLVVLPPCRLQAADGRQGQTFRIRPGKRGQRRAEIARRDTLQVQPGEQLLN